MNHFNTLFRLSLMVLVALALAACHGKKDEPVEAVEEPATENIQEPDTIVEPDTTAVSEVPMPTKRADELFDDFAFNFMKNKKFQKQRVAFPLVYNVDGTEQHISEKQWHHDSMYSKYEMYTLIFDSTKGEKAAKDTTLQRVVVEELDLDTQRAKSYKFERSDGEWHLTALTEEEMGNSANSDFYNFYHQFATDADFQIKHIASPLAFSTFDDDLFKTVETELTPEEFEEYAPELPKSKITNILYGQSFKNSKLRILSLRAPASGMECQMVFRKEGGEWKLTRLEN